MPHVRRLPHPGARLVGRPSRHLPITIQVEAKDSPIPDPGLGFVQPLPWTGPDFAALEREIDSVFPAGRVLAPAEVRGHRAMADAVRAGRWPRLDQVRGQVLFVLDDHGAKRDAYRAQVPDLADRRVFVDVPETDPDAAVMVVNDPLSQGERIRALVAAGFIVRTRADADTVQARTGDTSMRDAASGAQFVSTDYVFPDEVFGTGYVADLPGEAAARCNPVSARGAASGPTSAAEVPRRTTTPGAFVPPATGWRSRWRVVALRLHAQPQRDAVLTPPLVEARRRPCRRAHQPHLVERAGGAGGRSSTASSTDTPAGSSRSSAVAEAPGASTVPDSATSTPPAPGSPCRLRLPATTPTTRTAAAAASTA